MAAKVQPYAENGVKISKLTIYVGDEISLTYSGLLAQNGAKNMSAHIGYGKKWDEKAFIPMEYKDGSYTSTFKVTLPGSLNVCFKDSADNWDNNSLKDYFFKITKRATKTTKKTA